MTLWRRARELVADVYACAWFVALARAGAFGGKGARRA